MMNYFLYSIGNDVRSCEKEEYIPRDATGILKVQILHFSFWFLPVL